ncbi:MAG: peptide MFS transporter [Gemmataceae bacterium]|nr:peptide MFS transporter [Gemmataceae bacterium]
MKDFSHPARSDSTTVLGHPPGLFLLFIVEMWERFSYYGMRAILVLYLIATSNRSSENPGRGWTEANAYTLYGIYTGLSYLLPLLGGYLADKFLGTHRSMVVGALMITCGHIVLGLTGLEMFEFSELGMSVFIGGLALIIVGTGYFKPCVSVMVGQLYSKDDPRRDGAFTIFYMGINLGAFICAFVCGTLGETVGWHWGFGSAAVGMIAGLIVYLIGKPTFLKDIGKAPEGRPNLIPVFLFASIVACAAFTAIYHFRDTMPWSDYGLDPDYSTIFQIGLASALLVFVLWFISIQAYGDKGPTATVFIFMMFNAFFWIAFEQAGSTLNVFAQASTDRYIGLLDWEMPATWFQSVNPFLIIVMAPAFAAMWSFLGKRGLDPSQPVKIGIALLLVGLGYVFVVFAAKLNLDGTKVSMFWLLALYTVHTIGELFISPTGLAYVTKAAPVKYISFLMGIWFISSFLANYGGGLIASYVNRIESGEIQLPWSLGGRADFFMLFVVTSIGAGVIILVLTPLFKLMMRRDD